jgi:hypothetical protein
MYERRRYVIDMLSLLRQTVRTNTLAAVLNFHAFYFTLSPSLSLSVKITLSIQSLSHSIYSFFFYSLSLSIFSDRFPTEQKSVWHTPPLSKRERKRERERVKRRSGERTLFVLSCALRDIDLPTIAAVETHKAWARRGLHEQQNTHTHTHTHEEEEQEEEEQY